MWYVCCSLSALFFVRSGLNPMESNKSNKKTYHASPFQHTNTHKNIQHPFLFLRNQNRQRQQQPQHQFLKRKAHGTKENRTTTHPINTISRKAGNKFLSYCSNVMCVFVFVCEVIYFIEAQRKPFCYDQNTKAGALLSFFPFGFTLFYFLFLPHRIHVNGRNTNDNFVSDYDALSQ